MRNSLTVFALAVMVFFAAFSFSADVSKAAKPLDVDCTVLELTLIAADDVLDESGVQFKSLGELLSSSKKDEDLFSDLQGLIFVLSGETILFETPNQAISTIAKCGLIPLLVQNIKD